MTRPDGGQLWAFVCRDLDLFRDFLEVVAQIIIIRRDFVAVASGAIVLFREENKYLRIFDQVMHIFWGFSQSETQGFLRSNRSV